jgi:dihydrofolate reductase
MVKRREKSMNIVLAMVMSVDGKITKDNDPNIYSWTSNEDQQFFTTLIKNNNVIIIGGKTYDAVKQNIKLESGKLRIVLTRQLYRYVSDSIPGILEFSNETPLHLIKRLEELGFTNCLLASGSTVATLFLKAGLVNEIYLTVEPRIFGSGKFLVSNEVMDISLTIVSVEKLNEQGTLLLHYKVNNLDE